MVWDPTTGEDVAYLFPPCTPLRRIRKSPETKEREYRESLERYRMAIHDTVDQQRQNIIRERRAMEIEELLQILEW